MQYASLILHNIISYCPSARALPNKIHNHCYSIQLVHQTSKMLKQQIECPYAIVFNSNDNGNEDDNNASSKMCICKGKHIFVRCAKNGFNKHSLCFANKLKICSSLCRHLFTWLQIFPCVDFQLLSSYHLTKNKQQTSLITSFPNNCYENELSAAK